VRIEKHKDFYILRYTFLGRHKLNLTIQPVDTNTARLAGMGQFCGEKVGWRVDAGRMKMLWSGLVLEKE